MVTVQISLPDELAEAASAFDLLRPQAIEAILREEIRRRRISKLEHPMAAMADDCGAMTPEEIESELRRMRSAGLNAVGT
jgi:hypothetical protein